MKPSNFLIRIRPEEPEHPDLLLTDFGISRFMAGHSSTSQTIRGTPTYMAPEQWEGRPTYASDQYALAVMTYELLIGHPPFEGRSEPIWFKHLHVTPPAPSSLNTALPPGIDAVLLHALAKKPEERFASVSAFASALQEATTIKQPTIGSTRLLTFTSLSGLSLLPNPASQDQPVLAQPIHETQGTTEASEQQFSAHPESPTAPVSQPQFSPTPRPQIPPPPPPPSSDEPLKIDVGQFIVQPSVPSATPEANPGRYLALSKLPVIGVISRPPSQWRTPSTTRLLLAALALILLVISGGLLYTFAIAPNNTPSTRYPATTLTQAGNTTTPTSATTSGGAAALQSNTPVPATTQALTGNKQDAQAQVKVDTQATTQVTTQATPDAQATKQALANAQATTQALTDANNQALANTHATATAVAIMQLKAPLYRLNNAKTGDHFYTMSTSERDSAIAQAGYHYEGIAGYLFSTQIANTAPLYRLNNAKTGDHFYTMSASERDTAVAQDGYHYEGIAGYLFSSQVANTAPLYRLYSATTGDHFYTMSASERGTAVAQDGYQSEGIAGYLYGG